MTDKLTKLNWLEELYALSQTAASATDLEEALILMLRHIADGFSAGSGTIALVSQSDRQLQIAAGTDLPKEAIGQLINYGQGVLGRVAEEGKPVLINGQLDASKTSRPSGPSTRKVPSSSMCWPLKLQGQIMGVLAVNRFEPQPPFGDTDLQRGSIMVNMLALVIENLRMHREQKMRIDKLSQMNEEMSKMNRQLADAHTQMLQQEKLASIGQLAAGVAHEINNPLGFISANLRSLNGYVDELIQKLLAIDPHIKSDDDIQFLMEDVPVLVKETTDGLSRVQRIVQDLRDFSRVDASEEWEIAQINECLLKVINVGLIEHQARIDIKTELGDLPAIRCLQSQLNQAFLNILVNASQAITGQGTIRVRTYFEADQNAIKIEISDDGCGISQEHLHRIFEPFFTTRAVGAGVGLGLSQAYSIVRKHDGQLDVTSAVNEGSTFCISLPASGALKA